MEYIVENEYSGKTVREVIKKRLGISMATLKHLKFLDDGIMLNGVRVTVRAEVKEGDLLALATEDTESETKLTPCDLPLDIVYEDDFLVIPNKPADMPTHPSHDHYTDTVANALAFRYGEQGIPFVFRPVNRLDKDTSGLVLIAKHKVAAFRLSESMQKGEIHKSYLAVLCGHIPAESGEIRNFMHRDPESKMLRRICREEDDGAMLAITRYKRVAANDMFSVVVAAPITGRTHQLRLHFASLGFPICGDTLYGYPYEFIGRQALHAFRLSFPHPMTQQRLCFSVPLPPDMAKLCQTVFGTNDFSQKVNL